MRILPIAFDSFGVRSMATLVVTSKNKVFIDPGVALGPRRYGLPPADEERLAKRLAREQIINLIRDVDSVVVSHYHYDHHPFPIDDEFYKEAFSDKIVFAKDRLKNVHPSGKKRGSIFEKKVKDICKELVYADDQDFGNLRFSPAVWHGPVGSKVGRVMMVSVKDGGSTFVFGSDAQSLADPAAVDWVIKEDPDFLILDGFPTNFIGWRVSKAEFEEATNNLLKTIKTVRAEKIVLDHHLLRDLKYKEKVKPVYETEKTVFSAAEYLGIENFFLEAWRKDLHKKTIKVNVGRFFDRLKWIHAKNLEKTR